MSERAVLWRDLAVLSAVALVVRAVAAWLVPFPPHVDAAYATMVAEQLATGHGFTAPALWSFLEVGGRLPADPTLPVPSNAHWMPMPAIVAAAGMAVFGPEWRAGQVPMVLLSALLVPMTYLGGWLLIGSRRVAILGAVLAIGAGPLLLMYPLVESFAVFGVLGGGVLLVSVRAVDAPRPGPWLVLAGALAGLASLTRIDGTLLVLAPVTAWLVRRPLRAPAAALGWGALSAIAFLVVVAPWLLRNLEVFGTPLPSPGGRMLWIRDYNEHLSASLDLTLERYLDWGVGPILLSKVGATVQLIGRSLGLFGGIFAISFVAGLWVRRRDPRVAPFTVYFVVMFALMALLFTEHAPKGAFLHTAPAWLPLALPIGVAGIAPMASWLGRWWGFLRRPATHRFLEVVGVVGAVVLAVAGAVVLLGQWETRLERQEAAAEFLREQASPDDVLLASDPSALWLHTGLRGVATSFDPDPVIGEIVEGYGVDWIVVMLEPGEERDPLGLWDGEASFIGELAFEADEVRIYSARRQR